MIAGRSATFEARRVFAEVRAFPTNDLACRLCEFARLATLDAGQIARAIEGLEIVVVVEGEERNREKFNQDVRLARAML